MEGTIQDYKSKLTVAGFGLDNIVFTQFEDTLNWARDYGPDIMVDDKGNKIAINQNFNAYGQEIPYFKEASDACKAGLHQSIAMGIYDFVNSDMISEDGDKEFNGDGVLITLEDTEVRKRNPQYTKDEIEAEYMRIFNLKKVIGLPYPTFEDEEIYDGSLDVVNGKAIYRSLSANGNIDEMARFVV